MILLYPDINCISKAGNFGIDSDFATNIKFYIHPRYMVFASDIDSNFFKYPDNFQKNHIRERELKS